jgi:hypothetical protein
MTKALSIALLLAVTTSLAQAAPLRLADAALDRIVAAAGNGNGNGNGNIGDNNGNNNQGNNNGNNNLGDNNGNNNQDNNNGNGDLSSRKRDATNKGIGPLERDRVDVNGHGKQDLNFALSRPQKLRRSIDHFANCPCVKTLRPQGQRR